MKQRLNTYKAYSLGCVIVWTALLLAVAARGDPPPRATWAWSALAGGSDGSLQPLPERSICRRAGVAKTVMTRTVRRS